MTLDQESRVAFNINASWTNRFSVVGFPDKVRIAFAEAAPGETKAYNFHSAVMMSLEDAKQLAELLQRYAFGQQP